MTSRSSRIDFDVADGLHLIVEPHAPGVFRLRCAQANLLGENTPTARARAVAEMLLARQEAVGESVFEPREGGDGWRLTQGDVVLDIQTDPLRFSLSRAGEVVLRSQLSEHTAAIGYSALDDAALATWTVGFELQADESVYGLGETPGDMNRRGEAIVSDDPEHRALPLAWSPRGWGVYANTMRRVEHGVGGDPDPSA